MCVCVCVCCEVLEGDKGTGGAKGTDCLCVWEALGARRAPTQVAAENPRGADLLQAPTLPSQPRAGETQEERMEEKSAE